VKDFSLLFSVLSLAFLDCSWTAAWNALHINSKLSKGLDLCVAKALPRVLINPIQVSMA
jgi:hypothetical protein